MKGSFKVLAAAFCLLAAGSSLNAQEDPVTGKIIEMGRNDNHSMDYLDILCNRFGGRLIGSDAYDNAAEWCASKFEEWGLEVWMQECGEVPVGFNRGPWFGRMVGGNGMTLHFATPSYTVGTRGVQRGHVLIEPRTQAEFDRMKKELGVPEVIIGYTGPVIGAHSGPGTLAIFYLGTER